MMNYTEIRKNVWQIEAENGVYCTLIKGEKLAILLDTGFGAAPLKQFVEEHVDTDYIVMNTHGHPDHIGGNKHFDTVYVSEEAVDEVQQNAKMFGQDPLPYALKTVEVGTVIDLGGISAKVVSLKGHTKGSVGLLLEEERLLLAGDALNPELWMFNYASCPFTILQKTLVSVLDLDFDSYLFGHGSAPLPKAFVETILQHTNVINTADSIPTKTLNMDTLKSTYSDENGTSVILYDPELL